MNFTDWMDSCTTGTAGHEHELLLGPLWDPRMAQGTKSGCTEVWKKGSFPLYCMFILLFNKESEHVPEL